MLVRNARQDQRGFAHGPKHVAPLLDRVGDVDDPVIALRLLPRAARGIAGEQRRRFMHDAVAVHKHACRLGHRLGGIRGVLDDLAWPAYLVGEKFHRRRVGLDLCDGGFRLAHGFFLHDLRALHGTLRCLARLLCGLVRLLRDTLCVDAARRRVALRGGVGSGEAEAQREQYSRSRRGGAAIVFHERSGY